MCYSDSAIDNLARTIIKGLPETWGDLVQDGHVTINLKIQEETLEELIEEVQRLDMPRCRVCGCTDDNACPGGCYWVEDDLCSKCAEADEGEPPTEQTELKLIRVILLPVGKPPEVKEIPNTLEAFQRAVGGYIEAVKTTMAGHSYTVIVNEEGRRKELPPNVVCPNGLLVGDIVISKGNEEGEFISLTDEDVERLMWGLDVIWWRKTDGKTG